MKKKLFIVLTLLLCVTLAIAQEPEYDHLVYLPAILRPLQVTKVTQAMALVMEPNEGTFRAIRTSCYSYHDYPYDNWHGYCYTTLRNDTEGILIADTVSVTSRDSRVKSTEMRTTIPMALNAQQEREFSWFYEFYDASEPGPIIFDIEITCVGY